MNGPESRDSAWRAQVKQRALVVVVLIGLWVVGIQARLIQLQVFQHTERAAQAERLQTGRITLPPKRGDIVDRRGELLAYSADARSVGVDPSFLADPAGAVTALCAALGDCTKEERRQLTEKFGRDTEWVPVRRADQVSPDQAARVASLEMPGVVLTTESLRWYPKKEMAAHVLGFVGRDNAGLSGIERQYDDVIRGAAGVMTVRRDARRNRIMTTVDRQATAGATVELTIDQRLQYVADTALREAVREADAVAATAIVMVPGTGEILALSNYPSFNPNVYQTAPKSSWRNRAWQEVYEPGSTFKIVTASAALEEHLLSPSDLIDIGYGRLAVPGRGKLILDDHPGPSHLSFEDVIVKSSNVGAVQVGFRVGAERLTRYARRFGFGQTLTQGFAGESRGIFFGPADLNNVALSSVAMGYQISVTPLQMAAALGAIANGGELMEPHLVRAIVRDGVRQTFEPKVLRRSISPDTAATVTAFLEEVVARGTAKAARLERFQAAGKTGTAKKAVPGGYSETDRIASFAGFVPSRRAEFTILVVVDTPRRGSIYGGAVAAPIFKRIAEEALRIYGVSPTINPDPAIVLPTRRAEISVLPASVTTTPVPLLLAGGRAAMPDVRGLSARDAMVALSRAGLRVRITGAGSVVSQTPAAGEPIDSGGRALIELRRAPDPPGGGGRR